MLEPRAEGLWTADDPDFRLLKLPIGTRMTVVRLRDGRIVLISPIRLDPALVAEIRALGPVAFIIAPNRVHHLFAAQAKNAFPEARLLAAPGLPEKMRHIPFDARLSDTTSAEWREELEPMFVAGFPFLDEVVFFHPRTRTLIATDLCFNIRAGSGWAKLVFRLNDMWQRFGPSRSFRFLIRDRKALRASLDEILRRDFDRVIVAHGDVLESGGREALRSGYEFLYES
jgi:hypothetical protein